MTRAQSADHAEVFDHFGVAALDRPRESCYLYAPVFPTVVDGTQAAVKQTYADPDAAAGVTAWTRDLAARGVEVVTPLELPVANPVRIGDDSWVAYPWVTGRSYRGSAGDVTSAGDLLGRIHAADVGGGGLPGFNWPDHDQDAVDADVDGLRRTLGAHAPDLCAPVLDRLAPWLQGFTTDTLPAVRDADLPVVAGVADYKAANLVWSGDRPTLIDPDDAERLPRILDLALAAVLFPVEQDTAPPRPFTTAEWAMFLAAYRAHVRLEPREVDLWPTAVRYILLEWGVWTIADADNWGDWADPARRAFLRDLATLDVGRLPMTD